MFDSHMELDTARVARSAGKAHTRWSLVLPDDRSHNHYLHSMDERDADHSCMVEIEVERHDRRREKS